MPQETSLLEIFFPEDFLKYFTIVSFEFKKYDSSEKECMVIHFDEKNILPEGFSKEDYDSKGFLESKEIQDFPIRGKAVFLSVRVRRWQHKKTNKIIKRDYTFIADEIKMTAELADFLKGGSRYALRYHEQHSQLFWGESEETTKAL